MVPLNLLACNCFFGLLLVMMKKKKSVSFFLFIYFFCLELFLSLSLEEKKGKKKKKEKKRSHHADKLRLLRPEQRVVLPAPLVRLAGASGEEQHGLPLRHQLEKVAAGDRDGAPLRHEGLEAVGGPRGPVLVAVVV